MTHDSKGVDMVRACDDRDVSLKLLHLRVFVASTISCLVRKTRVNEKEPERMKRSNVGVTSTLRNAFPHSAAAARAKECFDSMF